MNILFLAKTKEEYDYFSIELKDKAKVVMYDDAYQTCGLRANLVLYSDNFTDEEVDKIIHPFIASALDFRELKKLREREDVLIAKGLIKEEERRGSLVQKIYGRGIVSMKSNLG